MRIRHEDTRKPTKESFEEYEANFLERIQELKDDFFQNIGSDVPEEEIYVEGLDIVLYQVLSDCIRDSYFNIRHDEKNQNDYWVRVPMWAVQSALPRVEFSMNMQKVSERGRNNKWVSRRGQDMLDYDRYNRVLMSLKEKDFWKDIYKEHGRSFGTDSDRYIGLTWDNVFEFVAEEMNRQNEFWARGGSTGLKGYDCGASAVKRSYELVKKRMKTEPHRYKKYRSVLG